MPKNPILYILGSVLILLNLIWFLIIKYTSIIWNAQAEELSIALLGLTPAFIYFMIIFFHHTLKHGWKKFAKGDEHLYSLALVLFSISAHTLNLLDLNLFAPYVDWMVGYVIMMHLAILAFPFRSLIPKDFHFLLAFINGAGLVMSLYLCIFLGPLILLAIPAALIFGLSMHATVPAWFFLFYIQSWFRQEPTTFNKRAFWVGVIIPLLVLSGFVIYWKGIQENIEISREEYAQMEEQDLPEWVHLASTLPNDKFTKYVMLAQAKTQPSFWNDIGRLGFGGEFIQHDPLALISLGLYGALDLEPAENINILETQYDSRHMTHRRLWRGNHLSTSFVKNEIDVYPAYRLAYEQMTIHIHHDEMGNSSRRARLQEAVYTFYLPEGSVATSLSLWIEGKEEKSILTTRSRADSAYEQIVGRERRDPALLHWQEGNRITVTIFPCTPKEDRIFKIGFTTPLTYQDGKLSLRHVSFDGPETWAAKTDMTVRFPEQDGLPAGLKLPNYWQKQDQQITYNSLYQPDWTLTFEAVPLATQASFHWKGLAYSLEDGQQQPKSWEAEEIILDLNTYWSHTKLAKVWKMVRDKEVYAFLPQKVRLTDENYQEVFQYMKKRSMTIVPFYKINPSKRSLVISASNGKGIILDDIEDTQFATKTSRYLYTTQPDIAWFSLDEEVPPYVQSLNELRVLTLTRGNMAQLQHLLTSHILPLYPETDNKIYIPSSQVAIRRDSIATSSQGTAPDHIYRLFAYQHIMNSIGHQYYQKGAIEEQWLKPAEQAFIVTPVTSLIVLETQEDYERFGIEKNEETIGNASIQDISHQGGGAVPEPHEWVLILSMGMLLLFIGWRKWKG